MTRVVDLEGYQFHETGKALLFGLDEKKKSDAVWLPLSQIEVEDKGILHLSGPVEVTLPEWLAIEKGLV